MLWNVRKVVVNSTYTYRNDGGGGRTKDIRSTRPEARERSFLAREGSQGPAEGSRYS